ncbi:MAG: type II secretion system protein GspD [Deltaproteobacteria bacterium]|nr:MAG: type II secretion system protein GspD [Deltaproteobacteria bacterium]
MNKQELFIKTFFLFLFLPGLLFGGQNISLASSNQKISKDKERFVTIDFDNVDIKTFIKFISELTGKNFVIDPRVRGKVTIVSPAKISVKEAYKVFESVLEVHGFTTVPAGDVIKIVPIISARSKDVETLFKKKNLKPEDKVITQLVHLRYADPNELRKILTPLVSRGGIIVPYRPTGMLIITDVMSNIRRLLHIIKEIDVKGTGEIISVIPLKYARAENIAKAINLIFQKKGIAERQRRGPQSVGIIKVVSYKRTNVLIVLASEDNTERIRHIISLLDKPIPRGKENIHVYYLQNADAEELVKVLTDIIPKGGAKEGKLTTITGITGEVKMVADKSTNSLVITASKEDYKAIEKVIKKLDIPRKMVYIEALIMEVSADKKFEIGVEWRATEKAGKHRGGVIVPFGGTGGMGEQGSYKNMPDITPETKVLPYPSGFSVGILGAGIRIGDYVFPTLGAVFRAYHGVAGVHILSTPQVLVTDNEEAEIKVGENVPYLTREEKPMEGTATGTEYRNYEYRDVGVSLKITPQINQDGFVKLKIFEEVIKLKKGTEQYTPTTLKRSAKTTVIVKNAHTVVIGGMIGESIEEGTYQAPCFGSIPGLGWLFKSQYNSRNRTNLFIFLTPRIVETPGDARVIYRKKKDLIEQLEIKGGVIKLYKNKKKKGKK